MAIESEGWKKIEVSPGHFVNVRPTDPEIVAKMPPSSRTFLQVGPIELIIHDIKKALHPYDEIPF